MYFCIWCVTLLADFNWYVCVSLRSSICLRSVDLCLDPPSSFSTGWFSRRFFFFFFFLHSGHAKKTFAPARLALFDAYNHKVACLQIDLIWKVNWQFGICVMPKMQHCRRCVLSILSRCFGRDDGVILRDINKSSKERVPTEWSLWTVWKYKFHINIDSISMVIAGYTLLVV